MLIGSLHCMGIIGGSCHKYDFCCDKHVFVATNHVFYVNYATNINNNITIMLVTDSTPDAFDTDNDNGDYNDVGHKYANCLTNHS